MHAPIIKTMVSPIAVNSDLGALHRMVAGYYTDKVTRHGPTPAGVDWSCLPTQEMRFVQLLKLCDFSQPLSLNDIGCGYGALLSYLKKRHRHASIDYLGVDLSAAMITHAKRLFGDRPLTAFEAAPHGTRVADYSVASGIFNVKLDQPLATWEQLVADTLRRMSRSSVRGFAVNFLTPPPAQSRTIPELYYAPSQQWRTHCEQVLGARVEVLPDYGMREYTLLVHTA
ncbi:class I SAM-dependent methyltransferase [Rhodoferax sp.]|uniref:class I SAM-dependent methyltransferase n=1 Tax=Rhodoferax sp. TaxID=50421 RepID=UPI0027550E9F|nr:class I SAM-dependent methyltransferase [Rhodoferax sp.]